MELPVDVVSYQQHDSLFLKKKTKFLYKYINNVQISFTVTVTDKYFLQTYDILGTTEIFQQCTEHETTKFGSMAKFMKDVLYN